MKRGTYEEGIKDGMELAYLEADILGLHDLARASQGAEKEECRWLRDRVSREADVLRNAMKEKMKDTFDEYEQGGGI